MVQKKYTQAQQLIDTLRKTGGYATLGDLYRLVDTKLWATKTPNESIRRIEQQSAEIFKIQPGLWALEECREEVMHKFDIQPKEEKSVEQFTHGYYQGLIIEIGKHPTQKPLRLLVRMILASTNQGDWILDPFSGSSVCG